MKDDEVCKYCLKKLPESKYISEYCSVECTRKYNAISSRVRKYGITVDDFRELLYIHNGQCAICGIKNEDLEIDHCHKNGHVRGLLCSRCNRGLGLFKDNIASLQKAINYLKPKST